MKHLDNIENNELAFMWADYGVNTGAYHNITGMQATTPSVDPQWAQREVARWLGAEPACVSRDVIQLAALDMSLFGVRTVGEEAVMQVVAHTGFTSLTGESEVGKPNLQTGSVWELTSVVSDPAQRGKGFGKLIVDQSVRFFDENRYGELEEILTVVCGEELVGFYEQFGFGFSRVLSQYPAVVNRALAANDSGKTLMTYNQN